MDRTVCIIIIIVNIITFVIITVTSTKEIM